MPRESYTFKKGQVVTLDDIYAIQGLAGGDWWDADSPNELEGSRGEIVTITRNIKITITWNP